MSAEFLAVFAIVVLAAALFYASYEFGIKNSKLDNG